VENIFGIGGQLRRNTQVEMPERFRVTIANGGMPLWTITFHTSSFEET